MKPEYTPEALNLQWLIRQGDHQQLKNMIDQGEVDVNRRVFVRAIPEVVTLLGCAAFFGRYDIFILLESHGAKRDIKDFSHPLFYAVTSRSMQGVPCDHDGKLKIAEYLLTHGTSPNIVDKHGDDTPLHYSIHYNKSEENYLKYSKFLLDHGADVDAKGYNDETPLTISSIYNKTSLVKLLLDHHANILLKNVFYEDALFYAERNDHHEIVLLLKQAYQSYNRARKLSSLKNLCIIIASNDPKFSSLPLLLKKPNTYQQQLSKIIPSNKRKN